MEDDLKAYRKNLRKEWRLTCAYQRNMAFAITIGGFMLVFIVWASSPYNTKIVETSPAILGLIFSAAALLNCAVINKRRKKATTNRICAQESLMNEMRMLGWTEDEQKDVLYE